VRSVWDRRRCRPALWKRRRNPRSPLGLQHGRVRRFARVSASSRRRLIRNWT